ncbi:hypothetical protein [Spiroplasma endosymbiont of Amphibalanus improvisus]|uniref:hypothetical protein n=1 Tax=Spiroplasma endosymbiont of Amphibalanus improvisus TaxID=3066327 RepID=UPI00313B3A8E
MRNFVGARSKNFELIFQIIFATLLSSLLILTNFLLIPIPGLEVTTFILMLMTIVFKKSFSLLLINIYCFLDLLVWWNDESIIYFFIFNLYFLICYFLKNQLLKNKYFFMFVLSIMGYTFSLLMTLGKWIIFGKSYAVYYLTTHVIAIFIHGTTNGIIVFFTYNKILNFLKTLEHEYFFIFNEYFLKKYSLKTSTFVFQET